MDSEQRLRYSRQILFPPIGESGQEKLLSSTVAVIGCGALGTFQVAALARAGCGTIIVVDRDYVEASNLQRQWLFDEADAREAMPKAAAAARAVARINSGVRVTPVIADLNPTNIEDCLEGAGLLLDATDNFETRYLVNDFAISNNIPWVYGAAVGSYGITMPVSPGRFSCLKCLYPDPPSGAQPTCETDGVLGSITSAIAAIQVADAIRKLTGHEFQHRITTLDVWNGIARQIDQPPPDPDCAACGKSRDHVHLNGERRAPISLCGRDAVQIHERKNPIHLAELAVKLEKLAPVKVNEFALRFFPAPYELTVFPDGRAIIKGTVDPGVARSLYNRYIGG